MVKFITLYLCRQPYRVAYSIDRLFLTSCQIINYNIVIVRSTLGDKSLKPLPRERLGQSPLSAYELK